MKKIFFVISFVSSVFLNAQVEYVAPLPLPITGTNGGTGVNNGSKTITLGGPIVTTGTATPTVAFPSTSYTYTMPSATSTVATLGGTETFTNKTLTAPICTTPTLGVASATSITFGGGTLGTYIAPTSYTPTWTNSGTANSIGNATLTAVYSQIGKTVTFCIYMKIGSTTTFGNGHFVWSLPVAMDASLVANGYTFICQRFNAGGTYAVGASGAESTTSFFLSSTAPWTSSVPASWATNDFLTITGTYFTP